MSHSKRNTSRAVFTSHEREQAKKAWASTSATLSRESFLPFAACRLCLEPAIDPVACPHGDLFCRECALSNILAQKREIKRLDKRRELEDRERADDEARRDAEARDRAVREFELSQQGLDVRPPITTAARGDRSRPAGAPTPSPILAAAAAEGTLALVVGDAAGAKKRKFEMDDEELLRIAAADRAKARKALEEDEKKAAEAKLPSFWVPSITPTSNKNTELHKITKKPKTAPVCPASPADRPHAYSLATLVGVCFSEEDEDGATAATATATPRRARVCPACKKVLSNASKAVLARPCGHVLCKHCVDRFMRPSGHHDPHAHDGPDALDPDALRCYVCDADLVDRGGGGADGQQQQQREEGKKKKKDKDRIKPGLVELRSEGTGFSAGGANQISKSGVAFQC